MKTFSILTQKPAAGRNFPKTKIQSRTDSKENESEGYTFMKLVIQKVSSASVETEGNCISSINKGFLVLVGIGKEDTRETVEPVCKENDKSAYLCR